LEVGGVIRRSKCKVYQSLADAVNGWRGSWDHHGGTTKGFATPQSLELALVLEVGKAESHLPSLPHARRNREAFPIANLTWEVLGCQDSHRCHHDKFDVGDRHANPFSLFWGILHHDNELGDTIRLHVVLHHVRAKQDHVKGIKPSTVGVKEGHDFDGRDLCVEGVGIFQAIVPNLINNVAEKLGHALLGRLVPGIVIESGFVGSLRMNANDCCGAYELGTMVSFRLDCLGEDGCEGMNPVQLVIGDDHEQWEKGFPDG
jgi:hypothetical protein